MLQCPDNSFSEFTTVQQISMVYTNIHVAHKNTLHNTFKHSFGIPKHIALHAQNTHFARQPTRHEQALMYGSPA